MAEAGRRPQYADFDASTSRRTGVVIRVRAARTDDLADADAPAGRYLTGLVVAPRWRRCGAGEALTRWRLERIHADGEPAFFFTHARNRSSIELHARLGFVEVGRSRSYLGEPFGVGTGVLLRCDPQPAAAGATSTSTSTSPAADGSSRAETRPTSR